MPPPPVSSACPRFSVDGVDNAGLASNLIEMSIVDRIGDACRCTVRFGNWGAVGGSTGYLYSDRHLLDFGKNFIIKLNDSNIFDGRIVGLEATFPDGGAPNLAVIAVDRLEDLRMVRRTRSFDDVLDADVVRRIAGEYGLTAQVDLNGPAHKVLAQINQTDFAFVAERVTAAGAMLWMEGTTLRVRSERVSAGSALELGLGQNLRRFTATADLTSQRTRLTVAGWDVAGKQAISHEADTHALSGLPIDGPSGPALLSEAFGDRNDAIVSAVPLTTEEAVQRADKAFRRMARGFIVGRGMANADARLQTGAHVKVSGVDTLAGGIYCLTEVKHLFDAASGMRTEFTAERASLGPV